MSSACEAMKKSSIENNVKLFSWANPHCSDMTFNSSANVFTNVLSSFISIFSSNFCVNIQSIDYM